MSLKEYIPPKVLESYGAQKFVDVLDALDEYKQKELYVMDMAFNQRVNFGQSARYLYENGQLPYFSEMPRWMRVRLIENAYSIFDLKGTKAGLDLFAFSICDGVVQNVDFTKWRTPSMLILDDLTYGTLPNGADLVTPATKVNYLFADSFSYYYGRVSFDLKGNYMLLPETRVMIMELLVDILAMVHPGTTSITVNFYTKLNVFIETLNY